MQRSLARSSAHAVAVALVLLAMAGCRKEEVALEAELVETINLNDLYGNRTATVHLGAGYAVQAYYSLAHDSLVGVYDKYAWDVALTHDAAPQLLLNSSIPGLRIARAPGGWEDPVDAAALVWEYDLPSRQPEDLAIGGTWQQVLVVDRGLDAAGVSRGQVKMLLTAEGAGWTLRTAALDGTGEAVFSAELDPTYGATYWSLDAGAVLAAPPRDSWDLLFTSYLFRFDSEADPFPYQVTGVLLNPDGRRAVRLDGVPFADVVRTPELEAALSDDADAIGYDWKTYDFEEGYAVTPDLSFAVECGEFGIRALTFTGFVNSLGEPGSPAFTHRLLP
ncbi:MAG: hypothetical protein ACO3YQ_07830 [Flavobacteriales bacterium]